MVRAGLEYDFLAPAQATYLQRLADSPVALELLDVPHGHHSFEHIDYTDESRTAVDLAITKVLAHLSH